MAPFAPLWDASGPTLSAVFTVLLLISILVSLVCVSVDMWVSPDIPRPLPDSLLPRFLSGDLPRPVTAPLSGILALLPLAAAWSIIGLPLLPPGRPSQQPLDT